jgi:hypothetical protein
LKANLSTKQYAILIASTLLVLAVSCGQRKSAQKVDATVSDSSNTVPAPHRGGVDASFLDGQMKRGDEVQIQLDKLRQAQPRDNKQIRELIVKRKGEILNAKKMIRESTGLTDSQKELMLSKLDEEAIDLAQELVAVSQ